MIFYVLLLLFVFFFFFFFFQAEDGIRDTSVTGVQTCALPISRQSVQRAYGTSRLDTESVCGADLYCGAGLVDQRHQRAGPEHDQSDAAHPDRKSTRLNSSHRCISYAVFCLKKKKKK